VECSVGVFPTRPKREWNVDVKKCQHCFQGFLRTREGQLQQKRGGIQDVVLVILATSMLALDKRAPVTPL